MLRGAGQAGTALRGAIAVVLAVTALARPSWLVEIDGTAVIPDDAP